MKTKLARISKRSLATVLAFLMIFSTLMVGTISTAEAAGTMSTFPAGMTIYFRLNSSRWNNPSTVYAFFFTTTGWSNSSGTYTSVSSTKNSDGFFTAQVPNDGKTYKRVQFRSANNVSGGNYTNVHAPDYVWSNTIYDNNSGNWNNFTNWGSYNTTKSNTDGKLYFDNSKTNWTGNIYAVVARNTGSWYFRADKMTAVSNAPDIYYINYPSTYSDGYTSIGFVSGSSVSSNSDGSTFYDNATNKTTFICGYAINNDSSTYVGEPVTSGSDVGYNLNYKSNTFNYFDQTYTLYSGAHGSAKIDGYQFTAHGTASANTQATASASNSTTMTIAKSSTVTVTPSPDTGYQVKSVTLDSKTGTALTNAGNGKYTYKSDGSAHSIYVEFEPRSYTVTLNTNGGTINAGNVTSYTYGTGATLPTNVTKSGYTFDGWYDNSSLTGSAVTTISTTATGAKEYWAKWTQKTFSATLTTNTTGSGTGGTITTPSGGTIGDQSVNATVSIACSTNTGYTFTGWTASDNTVVSFDNASSASTTITVLGKSAVTITANFTETTHTVSVSKSTTGTGDGGTISKTSVTGVGIATKGTVTATANTGYTFSGWTIPSGVNLADGYSTSDTTIMFNATADSKTITAKFTAIDYTVTAATAPSGIDSGNTITVNSKASDTVHVGDSIDVSVNVASGYKLTHVKYGSTPVTMSGTTGTVTGSFNMPDSNQTVTATFEAADPTVTTPSINSARYSALGNKYYTGDTYTTSATATNNTSITYKLVKGGVETTIDNPNSFTIGEAGTYTIKAIATNAPAGVTAKTANASTSSFTVLADSASTTKSITAYVDFHSNTPSTPSIKINNSASASLSRVGTSTVYSASVTVPYHYGPIAGGVNVALEDEFPAVITVDGNNYDVTISNSGNKLINGTTNEVWIEAQGALGTTSAEPQKTAVTNSSSTKRIYMARKNLNWYTSTIYYWKNGEESSSAEMVYLGTKTVDSNVTQYYFYYDVPSDVDRVKFQNGSQTGDYNVTNDLWVTGGASDYNCWYLYQSDSATNHIANSPQLITAPSITTYYNPVTLQTGSTTSIVPEGSGTFTYSSGNTSKVTVNSTGTISAIASGSANVTITSTGAFGQEITSSSGSTGSDTVTATTNVTVSDTALTGSFSVMSYNHVESTFSVDDNNQVKINSVSTVLHGSKASGSSSTVRGGGIVTSTGSDYTKQFTVKYAAPETDRGYGGLAVRVTANYTANDDSSYFDGWYVDGTKSTVYTTEDDAIRVDGNNYVLKFIHENTINVTLNYNYRVWDTENGVVYDAAKADDEHTIAKVKTETVKLKAASVTDTDAKDMLVTNCPSIVNDYFNYKLVTKKKDLTADASSDAYKYGFTVTTSGNNCTIEANLKRSAHKYTVTVNGYRYANTTYTYQKAIEIKAGEVMNAAGVYEFNNDTILNWYDGGQRMATGTSYKLRVTGDTTLTTTVGQSGDNNNGKAIISHKSHELKLDTSGIQKLTQNFYIADFINAELGGDEGEAEFVGGGVLYYAVNKTTGKATKAKITDNNGEADSDDLEDVINRVVDGNYTTDKDNVTDSTSNVVCRYKQYTAGSSIYKYSQSLQAYQYIFSQSMTNNSKYENYLYRVYAYFIYRVGDNYYISVSDNYADANLYEAE